jgi:NAD(P)-dependent dehydrogenase (short-subunit alcohol dehydrogenase family)
MKLFDLTETVTLITGGLGDLGRCLARAFASQGGEIALVDVDLSGADEARTDLARHNRTPIVIRGDVRRRQEVEAAVATVVDRFGRLDVLVNNAGINVRCAAVEAREEDYDEIMGVNVKGTFLFGQAAARVMISHGGGSIINIASITGQVGVPGSAIYCASKGAVIQFTRAWAAEWGVHRIRVNAISPMYLKTRFTKPLWLIPGKEAELVSKTPLGRIGEVDDIVGAAIYLASPASSLVTGHVLTVDGGWTAV